MQSATVRRSGDVLAEMLAAASPRQLSAAAFAIGVSTRKLERFAQGAGGLDAAEAQALGNFLLRGRFFIKAQGGERGGSAIPVRPARAWPRGSRR
jgi:hypothetical protein